MLSELFDTVPYFTLEDVDGHILDYYTNPEFVANCVIFGIFLYCFCKFIGGVFKC